MSDPADLSNLRDIFEPTDVPWWPLAPGWWILAAGIVAAGAIAATAMVAHHRRNAYRREALRVLKDSDPSGISVLLKRTALAAWPREEVASLTGEAWLAFLDRTGGTTAFTKGRGRCLETLAFGGEVDAGSRAAAIAAARDWIRRHRC